MKLMSLVALVGLAVAAASDVLELTTETFDDALKQHEHLLVAFTAPWCGHCKTLKPEYAKAATELKADNLFLANVDATKEDGLAKRFSVEGFPTLKFFSRGTPREYNGGRDKDSIVNWVRKKSGPSMVTVETVADFEKVAANAEVAVVLFSSASIDDNLLTISANSAALQVEDVPFAIVKGPEAGKELREKYNIPTTGEHLVLVNKFVGQDNVVHFKTEEKLNDETVAAWVAAHSLPNVVVFSQQTAPKIFRGDLKTHFLLFADESEAAAVNAEGEQVPETVANPANAALNAFREAAKELSGTGKALFVRVPTTEERVLSYFGIKASDAPAAVLVNMNEQGMKKFKFDRDMAAKQSYTGFVEDYVAGNLKPWLKSDAAPSAEDFEAANVKVIVGTSFQSAVIDSDADVLLEVYAPWCGHCKALAPTYETLGKAVKAAGLDKKLIIAKMDGTTNEIDYPGVNVRGFPTILFFPAGKKGTVVDYDGGRDLEGFANFLKSKATNDVTALNVDAAAGDADEDEEEESDE